MAQFLSSKISRQIAKLILGDKADQCGKLTICIEANKVATVEAQFFLTEEEGADLASTFSEESWLLIDAKSNNQD